MTRKSSVPATVVGPFSQVVEEAREEAVVPEEEEEGLAAAVRSSRKHLVDSGG